MIDIDRRRARKSAHDCRSRFRIVDTDEHRVVDQSCLCSHRSVRIHREEAEIQRVAERETVERAQVIREAATEDIIAVVLDAGVAQRVAHCPRLIEAMLEEAAARPLRAMEKIVARLTGEGVARNLSVWVRPECSL